MRRKKPEVVSSLSAVQKTEFSIGAVVLVRIYGLK